MRLQSKLLCATLPAIALAMLTLGLIAYVQLQSHAEQALHLRSRVLLDDIARRGDTLIATVRANTRLFASTDLIERYVRSRDEAERYELLQPALLRLFAAYRAAYPEYREIRLVFPDGFEDTRLARPEMSNRRENETHADWFDRAVAESGAQYSVHLGHHEDDGEYSLFVTRPIRLVPRDELAAWHEPELRAYLSVNADISQLLDAVRTARLGDSGYLALIDLEGRTLASGAGALPESIARRLARTRSDTDLAVDRPDSIIDGESVSLHGRWLNDLLLVSVLPAREFTLAGQRLALSVFAVTTLAIIALSCLLFLSLRRLVLSPVGRMRDAAVAIGDGAVRRFPATRRGDELGQLARAFQRMHEQVTASVDALTSSHRRIEQLAYRDELTELPNRRLFLERTESALKAADARGPGYAILFLDLDEFKRVNDLLGHDAGDELLREVAQRLLDCVDQGQTRRISRADASRLLPSDAADARRSIVARLGGDEFIILFPSADQALVTELAQGIVQSIRKPIAIDEHRFTVGTSIGVSCWPADGSTVSDLVKCADTAMYEAKRLGKNTYRRFDDDMRARTEERLLIEDALQAALCNDTLSLVYQPQYAADGERLIGMEALVRWQHVELGEIPPARFVPIAEQIGLIGDIGDWVLASACRQWRRWADAGIAPPRLGVNVSTRQLRGERLVELVGQALSDHAMDPTVLELEVTETSMMEAPAEAVENLRRLRDLGVRIAMDDFGTGYSSLAALTTLPIDTLKIDRSFVTGIRTDSEVDKVVTAILTLAHNLDLEIIAEGVETASELEFLAERRCDNVQGYLLGRPLDADEMTERLRNSAGATKWRKAG